MAAPIPAVSWMKNLNQNSIFDCVRQNKDKLIIPIESKRWLAVNEGELYLWDSFKTCVLTTNLKSLTQKTEGSHQVRLRSKSKYSGLIEKDNVLNARLYIKVALHL